MTRRRKHESPVIPLSSFRSVERSLCQETQPTRRANTHERIKNELSCWLQPGGYKKLREAWDRQETGLTGAGRRPNLFRRIRGLKTPPPTEILRHQFRPSKVRVLLVGESPPTNGTFFYKGDSNLFRYTRQAFEEAFGTKIGSNTEFFDMFKGQGYYLDDLCPDALGDLADDERERSRMRAIVPLAARIGSYAPEYVIVIMKAIERHVREAAKRASIPFGRVSSLAFPATGNQRRYVEGLVKILREIVAHRSGPQS